MRRMIVGVCAAAMLASVPDAFAQKTMYAGIKGGPNVANLYGDDADGLDSKYGFIGGAYYGVRVGPNFGGRIEGLYVMKGAEGPLIAPGSDHAHESTLTLDYIEFPVLFTADYPLGDKLGFMAFAGPTFGFNLTAELEDKDHGETVDLGDDVASFEFGGTFGAGLKYMFTSMAAVLDVRYSLGFQSVVDEGDADVKTNGLGVMAGLEFPLGAK